MSIERVLPATNSQAVFGGSDTHEPLHFDVRIGTGGDSTHGTLPGRSEYLPDEDSNSYGTVIIRTATEVEPPKFDSTCSQSTDITDRDPKQIIEPDSEQQRLIKEDEQIDEELGDHAIIWASAKPQGAAQEETAQNISIEQKFAAAIIKASLGVERPSRQDFDRDSRKVIRDAVRAIKKDETKFEPVLKLSGLPMPKSAVRDSVTVAEPVAHKPNSKRRTSKTAAAVVAIALLAGGGAVQILTKSSSGDTGPQEAALAVATTPEVSTTKPETVEPQVDPAETEPETQATVPEAAEPATTVPEAANVPEAPEAPEAPDVKAAPPARKPAEKPKPTPTTTAAPTPTTVKAAPSPTSTPKPASNGCPAGQTKLKSGDSPSTYGLSDKQFNLLNPGTPFNAGRCANVT